MVVSLEEAREHCRTHRDVDDLTLGLYIQAASEWLEKIGVDTLSSPVPAPIKQACLLLVGHYFENREAVPETRMDKILPYGVDALIAPYREQCV